MNTQNAKQLMNEAETLYRKLTTLRDSTRAFVNPLEFERINRIRQRADVRWSRRYAAWLGTLVK